MKGNNKLIAAPLNNPHIVGGVYSIIRGELDEDGGDGEMSSLPEYCSESEGMVIEDSVKGSEDMVGVYIHRGRLTECDCGFGGNVGYGEGRLELLKLLIVAGSSEKRG
jgi:hypothetical protein